MSVLRRSFVVLGKGVGVWAAASGGARGISRNLSTGYGGHLIILGPCEFLVLKPEVGFDDFGRSQPAQDCSIAACKVAMGFLGQNRWDIPQNCGACCHRGSGHNAIP